jgi:NAD-dependent dihydropyrimidine dehydrogenase PreA subunit
MKLSPHPNIQEIAIALEQAGVDGLVMINSFGPCLSIDLETGLPLMGSKDGFGWLSGAAIKPLALRCVYQAARVVKIPIFGVGGVTNGRDAAEMFMAGASAVQVCTEAILRGPTVYGRIAKELNAFLDSHGYNSVEEIRGLTIRRMAERGAPKAGHTPHVDMERCSLCGQCEVSCPYRAITADEKLNIDEEKCFVCGLCVSRCKRGALSMAI